MNSLDTADQIIKVLDNIGEKFGMAFNGAKDNILPYLQQLGGKIIAYEIGTSWFWVILGAVILIAGLLCILSETKWGVDLDGFLCVIGFGGMVIGFIFIAYNAYHIVECYTFPERVILDYIQEFIKTHK